MNELIPCEHHAASQYTRVTQSRRWVLGHKYQNQRHLSGANRMTINYNFEKLHKINNTLAIV